MDPSDEGIDDWAMSEERIGTIMTVTGKDRDTVLRTLSSCYGDVTTAVNRLLTETKDYRDKTVIRDGKRMIRTTGGRLGLDPSDEISEDGGEDTEDVDEATNSQRRGEREYLTLKVVQPSQDQEGLEIHFRVRLNTCMGKLKKSYCERIGVNLSSLRFLYDGRRVVDEATPDSLEMESGDFIEVYRELGINFQDQDVPAVGNVPDYEDSIEPLVVEQSSSKKAENQRCYFNKRSSGQMSEIDLQEGKEIKRPKTGPLIVRNSSQQSNHDGESVRDQLNRITRKYEDLVNKLRDKVECPVCFDVPKKAPIPVCPNGHVVCVRCVRDECPTCRERMEQGTSTLAVTVIENIDHQCQNEGCELSFPLKDLVDHNRRCNHRLVKCPGLDCNSRVSLSSLLTHVVHCCIERHEIKTYKLPHKFTYMINEDIQDLSGEDQNFNWKLEALRFDDQIFFLKVTRKARRNRWFFFVQMMGSQEDCQNYGVTIIVFKSNEGPNGKYSQRYSGDICPIDVTVLDEVEDKGYCVSLKDGALTKFFVKNLMSGENELSVSVNIFKNNQ